MSNGSDAGSLDQIGAFEGTYHEAKVTGKNFVEMFGDWQF